MRVPKHPARHVLELVRVGEYVGAKRRLPRLVLVLRPGAAFRDGRVVRCDEDGAVGVSEGGERGEEVGQVEGVGGVVVSDGPVLDLFKVGDAEGDCVGHVLIDPGPQRRPENRQRTPLIIPPPTVQHLQLPLQARLPFQLHGLFNAGLIRHLVELMVAQDEKHFVVAGRLARQEGQEHVVVDEAANIAAEEEKGCCDGEIKGCVLPVEFEV